MDAVIAFYTSTDPKITLSTKLLEVVFVLIGLVAIYAGISNFRDKTNAKRIGTGVFWTMLGLLFYCGQVDPFRVDRRWPYCYAASGSVQAGRTW